MTDNQPRRSLFWMPPEMKRAFALAVRGRLSTLEWLADLLAEHGRVPRPMARAAISDAIPLGYEACLSEGGDFIFALDAAARALGINPLAIPLRPGVVQ